MDRADVNLRAIPFRADHRSFWQSVFGDEEVNRHMYSHDAGMGGIMQRVREGRSYTVETHEGVPIGLFVLHPLDGPGRQVNLGLAFHKDFRDVSLSLPFMATVEHTARECGYSSIRLDVYDDDHATIGTITAAGFKPFRWFEKNIG
jgi:hypothetical protein